MSDEGIRHAASVIATRESMHGPEVLVVERSSRSRFLPGYVAFPGGAVDGGDADLAERWFGDGAEAARAAAVRELIEETGIALTAGGARLPTTSSGGDAEALALVDADPPSRDGLCEIAHWIAPPDVPVRFDARYFAVAVESDVEPVADGGETAAAWWIPPARLLDDWAQAERKLYWPTWLTVKELAGCGTVDELLALHMETREPDDHEVAAMPASVFWQDR